MFTVTVTTPDAKQALSLLSKLAEINVPTDVKVSETATTKRGRPAKTEEKQMDLGFGDDEDESEDHEQTAAAPTLDEVIDAFKAYATKHSREKAAKVLTKLGVKSVRDLKAEQYADVLEILARK